MFLTILRQGVETLPQGRLVPSRLPSGHTNVYGDRNFGPTQ